MSAGLLALFLFILLALGFADKNWLNTPDKIWSRSPGANTYKGITRLLGRGSVRITPAHAGKRGTLPQGCTSQGDHPRACGEKSGDCLWNIAKKGSPPRVRGKETGRQNNAGHHGITPARAGKRERRQRKSLHPQDHPRACGEKPSPSQG